VDYAVYASARVADLDQLPWVDVKAETPSARWVLQRPGERTAFTLSSPSRMLDALVAGLGKYVLPTFVGDSERELVRLTNDTKDLAHPCRMVLHDTTRHDPAVHRLASLLPMTLKASLSDSAQRAD
jgi:DNA-binding transcriptional LysR family regulator